MWALPILQEVRTICLLSFSGKFLREFQAKNWSVKLHRSLPSIRSSEEIHSTSVSCPENRDYMSRAYLSLWKKTNTSSIFYIFRHNTLDRFHVEILCQQSNWEIIREKKKNLSPSYSICIYWGYRRAHGRQSSFLGFNFQEPLSQQGQQPKECKSEALTTGEEV